MRVEGPRPCPGINVATIEITLLAVHVLHLYHLEPVSDQPPQQSGTTIPNGIPMRVTPVRCSVRVVHSV